MTMTDPISDMLTRIRNGQRVGKSTITVPASKMKSSVLSVLETEGYIAGFEEAGEGKDATLTVTLKYSNGQPVITKVRRLSRPGLRRHVPVKEIPLVHNGLGVAIVSTSNGVISDAKARELGIGGELICEVF